MALTIYNYDRSLVYEYAKLWAYARNPNYYDFSALGGDCTNFCSQCVYAGTKQMNYTKTFGWYYTNLNDRAPAWTGVEQFYNFLINNTGVGPFAVEIPIKDAEVGDVVQLGNLNGDFYHSPIVTSVAYGNIYVSAHSNDTFNRNLLSYNASLIRCAHILGFRKYE